MVENLSDNDGSSMVATTRMRPPHRVQANTSTANGLRAGHCSDDKLYATRRRHSRDVAVLMLLDASLSTDGWVANRRVIDVEKESVVVLGEALAGLYDDVAIAAFYSQTRRDCRFLAVKGFREPWAARYERLCALEPCGYTRVGPALRHATELLLRTRARKRLLLLVSDGKPTGASTDAAVVEAAYRTLLNYFPAQGATLDALYAEALIPDGQAKDDGKAVGLAAANSIIDLRADDGRLTPIGTTSLFPPKPPGPGVWRLTPPAFAAPQVPWTGSVRPSCSSEKTGSGPVLRSRS